MKVLVLGGTQFVGRHLVEAALDAGHEVTLFNRGKTNPGLYPAAEEIHGDRFDDLDRLAGRSWDVVFDPSGYLPRVVRKSAEFLKDTVERYVFVSSISVYAEHDRTTEGDPVEQVNDPTTEEISAHYGGLKALCEKIVTEVYGDRGLSIRPGFIVGPYDPAARLPYLLRRYDSDGERIAGRPDQMVQLIHARDLANWTLGAVAQGLSGEYNLTGQPFPMRDLLETIIAATGKQITITWTDDAFLQANEISMNDGITYWIPAEFEDFMRVSIQKALDTGLKFMPLTDIIADTLKWVRATPANYGRFSDIVVTPEREAELLAKWHEQQGQAS